MLRTFPLAVALAAMILGFAVLPGPEAWSWAMAEGDQLSSSHHLLAALQSYEDGLPATTSPAAFLRKMAGVRLRRGDAKDAAALYQRARQAGDLSREVELAGARALHSEGETGQALSALQEALRERPGDEEAWSLLVEWAARAGYRPGEIAGLLRDDAGSPLPAPTAPRASYLLAACLLDPWSPEGAAAVDRASAGGDGQLRAAAAQLREAAQAGPDDLSRRIALARHLLGKELLGPALAQLEAARIESPENPELLTLTGLALMRSGKLEEAEQAVRGSLAISPGQPLSLYLLGDLLRRKGDSEGAVALLLEATRAEPGNPAVYLELASALIELGDFGDADRAMELAIQADPSSVDLRLSVAAFYADHQYRVEESLDNAQEAVRLSGRSARALGTLGWAMHLSGRSHEALDLLLEAVGKEPETALLRYRLGSVYDALGQPGPAGEQYLMVGEVDGSGDQWRRAQVALEGLRSTPVAENGDAPPAEVPRRVERLMEGIWNGLMGVR